MDLPTRDRYRRATERMANAATERVEVARRAVAARRRPRIGRLRCANGTSDTTWLATVVWLLRRSLDYRPSADEALREGGLCHPATFYLGGISVVTAGLLAILIAGTLAAGGTVAAAAVMCSWPCSLRWKIAVGVMNLIVTSWLPPRVLPKLEFKDGVPTSHATLVVRPVPAHKRAGNRIADQPPRTALSGEPRTKSEVRFGDRRRRRRSAHDAVRRGTRRRATAEINTPERALCTPRGRSVLSHPPSRASGTSAKAAGWAGNGNAAN